MRRGLRSRRTWERRVYLRGQSFSWSHRNGSRYITPPGVRFTQTTKQNYPPLSLINFLCFADLQKDVALKLLCFDVLLLCKTDPRKVQLIVFCIVRLYLVYLNKEEWTSVSDPLPEKVSNISHFNFFFSVKDIILITMFFV